MLGSMICGSDSDKVGPSAWPQFPSNEIGTGGDPRNKCACTNETLKIICYKTPIIAKQVKIKIPSYQSSVVE